MPYHSKAELPDNVKKNLPQGAQTIYKEAYNNAEETYQDPEKRRGGASKEETAHRVAWNAVKKKYEKKNGEWKRKD
ncbi:MAG: ChaB family protein [Persicimonas sp.]